MNAPLAFTSVLVANRGEIAVRILRTVQSQGLRGLVVYHAVDALTPAVALADQAIEITGATPVAAYLNGRQIIARAKEAGAEAIHPGYGFQAENADFARAVGAAGLIFIGPTPEAIELMGDKVRARNFVAAHGFPVAPSAIEDDDPATFLARARAVGAPLLIKPAAGGGGKGMHLALLEGAIERARSEAERYFGDGRLYAERYIERPRHIEVQVLGDASGKMVHLFERECSLQRRFQKIVEETPSPALDTDMRRRICDTAAGIARAAGYRNAGTIEFIYGPGDGAGGELEFYFLEMNTRLQVEHPVTEAVTGADLVAAQLRIASGHKLWFAQEDVVCRGHAIELRIYAEDSTRDFAPATGRILAFAPPAGDGVRVDSGVRQGQEVIASFDPMLAKLIVHADTRAAALDLAAEALRKFILLGCRSNIGFLIRLIADSDVRAGRLHTGLIAEKPELAAAAAPDANTLARVLAIAALSTRAVTEAADAIPALHGAIGDWRN